MGNGTRIRSVHARQVMDCKFRPVVEVDVVLQNGTIGRGAAPTGTSVGKHEAYVLRDNDPACFCGLSVFRAVDNVNRIIAPAIVGMDVLDQEAIDMLMIEMDGTHNKSRLGGNAIYSVSIACMQAAAKALNLDVYQYLLAGKN
jgi:enolase